MNTYVSNAIKPSTANSPISVPAIEIKELIPEMV